MPNVQWTIYTNEQESDQNYAPYALWEFDRHPPDPYTGELAVRGVYTVILKSVPARDEQRCCELIERKLDADCCVVYWQHVGQ